MVNPGLAGIRGIIVHRMRRGASIHHGNPTSHCALLLVRSLWSLWFSAVRTHLTGAVAAGCAIRPPGHPHLTVYTGRNIMI